jgi:hypothetical protein
MYVHIFYEKIYALFFSLSISISLHFFLLGMTLYGATLVDLVRFHGVPKQIDQLAEYIRKLTKERQKLDYFYYKYMSKDHARQWDKIVNWDLRVTVQTRDAQDELSDYFTLQQSLALGKTP